MFQLIWLRSVIIWLRSVWFDFIGRCESIFTNFDGTFLYLIPNKTAVDFHKMEYYPLFEQYTWNRNKDKWDTDKVEWRKVALIGVYLQR